MRLIKKALLMLALLLPLVAAIKAEQLYECIQADGSKSYTSEKLPELNCRALSTKKHSNHPQDKKTTQTIDSPFFPVPYQANEIAQWSRDSPFRQFLHFQNGRLLGITAEGIVEFSDKASVTLSRAPEKISSSRIEDGKIQISTIDGKHYLFNSERDEYQEKERDYTFSSRLKNASDYDFYNAEMLKLNNQWYYANLTKKGQFKREIKHVSYMDDDGTLFLLKNTMVKPGQKLTNLAVDQKGKIWFGVDSKAFELNGISRLNPSTKSIKRFYVDQFYRDLSASRITACGGFLLLNKGHRTLIYSPASNDSIMFSQGGPSYSNPIVAETCGDKYLYFLASSYAGMSRLKLKKWTIYKVLIDDVEHYFNRPD